jgi:hypothetical protein
LIKVYYDKLSLSVDFEMYHAPHGLISMDQYLEIGQTQIYIYNLFHSNIVRWYRRLNGHVQKNNLGSYTFDGIELFIEY